MDISNLVITAGLLFLFGAVAAKWAMELGYSQVAQIGLFVVSLIFGPFVLLHLYIKMLHVRSRVHQSGAQLFGSSSYSDT